AVEFAGPACIISESVPVRQPVLRSSAGSIGGISQGEWGRHSSFSNLPTGKVGGTEMAKSQIREYVEALLLSVVLAAFIIIFIAQSFLVEGSSMEPSFHDGQRLMVEKVSYRFSEPKRGDVVVFRYPGDLRRKFIKRVI